MKNLVMLIIAFMMTIPMFAQQMGGGQQGGPQIGGPGINGVTGKTVIVNNENGLFVLRSGVIAKYSTNPLKQVLMAQLFGAGPVMPTDMTDRTAMQKYMTDMQKRQAPAVMIEKDNMLLIIIGDYFVRMNETTLQAVGIAIDLRANNQTTDQQQMRMNSSEPGYLVVDDTIFIMRNTELISISITEGKINSRVTLSKELQITQPANQMGGNRGGNNGNGQQNQQPPQMGGF